jgi:hypothetical protein
MHRYASLAASALLAIAATALAHDLPAATDKFGFDVNVLLSPKAAATLARRGEGLFLFASYYGDPGKGTARKYLDEVGRVDLTNGSVDMTVPGRSGPVHFKGPVIGAQRLAMIDGPVMVNLNIASARKSAENNLLICDFIDGNLADVRAASPVTLYCGLIEENPKNHRKP